MFAKRWAWAALAAACLTGPAAADTIHWKSVSGWDISFYPGAEGCQAFAVFEQDTAFFIGFDSTENQLSLDLTLLDQRWSSLEQDKNYEVSVQFGNESPWTVTMTGLAVDGYPGLHILINAGSDKAALFVEEFQRKTFMEWTYQGNLLGRFTLRGSRKAFDEVIRCQRSYSEAKASQSDPFSTKKNDPFAD